jgi:hypothetical protein
MRLMGCVGAFVASDNRKVCHAALKDTFDSLQYPLQVGIPHSLTDVHQFTTAQILAIENTILAQSYAFMGTHGSTLSKLILLKRLKLQLLNNGLFCCVGTASNRGLSDFLCRDPPLHAEAVAQWFK